MTERWMRFVLGAVAIVGSVTACAAPLRALPVVVSRPAQLYAIEAETPPGWGIYSNPEHGFAIAYPRELVPMEPGDFRLAAGAVISFVSDSSFVIDPFGVRTNLIEVSVTVAVGGTFRPVGSSGFSPPAIFTRTRSCEGAAGNRYETIVDHTTWCGAAYDVILLIHSANPDCFPPGAIVPFDRDRLLTLFERMFRTFTLRDVRLLID